MGQIVPARPPAPNTCVCTRDCGVGAHSKAPRTLVLLCTHRGASKGRPPRVEKRAGCWGKVKKKKERARASTEAGSWPGVERPIARAMTSKAARSKAMASRVEQRTFEFEGEQRLLPNGPPVSSTCRSVRARCAGRDHSSLPFRWRAVKSRESIEATDRQRPGPLERSDGLPISHTQT